MDFKNGFNGFGNFQDGNHDMEDFAEKFKQQKGKMTRGKKIFLIVLAVVILFFLFAGRILEFVMEIWKINEIGSGFTDIFWKNLFCKALVSAGGFLVVFLVSSANLFALRKFGIIPHTNAAIFQKKWPYWAFAFLFSFIFGGVMGENGYVELLSALNATEFGVQDPLFQQDVGYYVFIRPFFNTIVSSLKGIFLLQAVLVAVCYYLIFFINGSRGIKQMIRQERGALTHVLANVILYYITMSLSYRLTAEGLLFGTFGSNGEIAGAGFIETNIWLPYYRFAPYLILLSVILTAICLWRKKYKLSVGAVLIVPAIYVLVFAVSVITQQFVVAPDERNSQSAYIEHNMTATKQAFGLDKIKEVQFNFDKQLTTGDIHQNKNELLNTRIIDFSASLTAYNQLQYFRKYYTFNDIDVVPYEINGQETGVFLSARELDKDRIEETARSYTNERFRYTHGFGVVASPFHRITADGQPDFVLKDIPPSSQDGMPQLTQPRIYYGESTNDYVIVGGANKELDYSEGYTDIEYTYDGDSGVQLTFFKKLLYSIYYGDYKMFFSKNISADSRILINRNVLDRVKTVAPFFRYEQDPCIVVDDNGEIWWVVDGFTSSTNYPYAQSYGGVNYIRNSVKVLVNAYTGDMTFYMIDKTDPIVKTYQKIYPSLFTEEPIPDAIKNHLTVPEGLFSLQAQVYQRYHLDEVGQFYDQSDVWRISTEKYQNNEITVSPYFNMFTIEGESEPELVLTLPYVLGDKYNMVGILMLRSNPEHYGELVLYRIPKSSTVYGPMQIENKIDNDPDISREMTLWGQGGSTVIRGNLLVIPFENSIFYVEPVYITSQNNASLPEVKRIIVAYKDAVVMAPTLEEALSRVLKTSDGLVTENLTQETPPQTEETEPVPQHTEIQEKIQRVLNAYDAFRTSNSQNNWDQMGKDLKNLEDAMNGLR